MPVAARARLRRRLLAAALAGITAPLLVIGGGSHPAYAQTEEQRLSQLQQDAAGAADDIGVRDAAAQKAALALARLQDQVHSAEHALNGATVSLRAAQKVLVGRRAALGRAQTEEQNAQIAVTVATAHYNRARNQLRVMLRAAFEEGVGGDLDALMQGGTPDDLADRVGLLDRLSASRQDRLAELARSREAVVRKEQALTAARKKAQDLVLSANRQVDAVAALQQKRQAATAHLVSLQHDQEGAVLTAKKAAAGARKRYNQLQAASARLQGILAARAAAERGSSGLPLSTGNGAESSGGLIMPVTGTFSSGFGYRVDPFGLGTTFHAGQDIAAPTGTPIYAATAGTVAIVETPGESGGYGNYTCIDRGAGFATCYAHQSAVFVHVGQVVTQRQEIGLVGSTGASTGPHLHFEVRLNGVPVDPVPYLP